VLIGYRQSTRRTGSTTDQGRGRGQIRHNARGSHLAGGAIDNSTQPLACRVSECMAEGRAHSENFFWEARGKWVPWNALQVLDFVKIFLK
jgi:hypothetical protein